MKLRTAERLSSEATTGIASMTIVNAVWTATALLHRQFPDREAFAQEEIFQLVMDRHMTEGAEESVRLHVSRHSVANKKPQPNRACMLFDPGGGLRRLYRAGDPVYPGKDSARTHPNWEDLPWEYRDLRWWYEEVWQKTVASVTRDPLFALIGTWNGEGESADDYVARLRSGWGEDR